MFVKVGLVSMKIFPAIDLRFGKVVRLTEGDYNTTKEYSNDPVNIAKGFYKDGARYLHMVDLDGAKDGNTPNFDSVCNVAKQCDMFIEIGGGIRDEYIIKSYLDAGVDRVIIGTVAVENPDFLKEMVDKYKEKIAVGIDARNGKIATKGWTEITDVDSVEYCNTLNKMGVDTIIYTDIEKDGKMMGTNIDIYKQLSQIKGTNIVASGGITTTDELMVLKKIGVYGAIVGKAIYEGAINLERLLIDMGE